MIHTVKGFGIVNKAEIDVFLELSCFFDDPADVGNLISGSIQKTKIMASSTITLCQIDGETVETVTDFVFLGSRIAVDDGCKP